MNYERFWHFSYICSVGQVGDFKARLLIARERWLQVKKHMKYSLLILLLLLMSCDSKEQTEFPRLNSDYVLYGLMIEKYSSSTHSIEDEMYSVINKNDLSSLKNAEKYDSLTIDYKLYLENVFQKILENATTNSEMDYSGDLSNKSITNDDFFFFKCFR